MRKFTEADGTKKKGRIDLPENPGNLPEEMLTELGEKVKRELRDGYLTCAIAWKIADESGVSRISVGAVTDKLGMRVTDCQIGCFKVDKTLYSAPVRSDLDENLINEMTVLEDKGELTCVRVFQFAKEYKLAPLTVSHEASSRKLKIMTCQLGCF